MARGQRAAFLSGEIDEAMNSLPVRQYEPLLYFGYIFDGLGKAKFWLIGDLMGIRR